MPLDIFFTVPPSGRGTLDPDKAGAHLIVSGTSYNFLSQFSGLLGQIDEISGVGTLAFADLTQALRFVVSPDAKTRTLPFIEGLLRGGRN